ncbi:MAG: DUF3179 domain-containing (seleno)protein [Planctomycetota bacterium]
MCHSGVGLTPVVDGRVHHFSAGGLYNGLVLLIDDETRTYWDHISGEAVHGPLAGAQLPTWSIEMTTVEAALANSPELLVYTSRPGFFARWIGRFVGRYVRGGGFLPPGFRKTMGECDARLPRMEPGLGVIVGREARFYPTAVIGDGVTDLWGERALRLERGPLDKIPFATWIEDPGARPRQLFSRWYGFAYTYPEAQVFSG